eukprot:PhM_4_TR14181/c0_g1_i1/m.80685
MHMTATSGVFSSSSAVLLERRMSSRRNLLATGARDRGSIERVHSEVIAFVEQRDLRGLRNHLQSLQRAHKRNRDFVSLLLTDPKLMPPLCRLCQTAATKVTPTNSDSSSSSVKEMAELLLEFGADVNQASPDTGNTPLHLAAQACHLDLLVFLRRRGASLDALNRDSISPVNMCLLADSGSHVHRALAEKIMVAVESESLITLHFEMEADRENFESDTRRKQMKHRSNEPINSSHNNHNHSNTPSETPIPTPASGGEDFQRVVSDGDETDTASQDSEVSVCGTPLFAHLQSPELGSPVQLTGTGNSTRAYNGSKLDNTATPSFFHRRHGSGPSEIELLAYRIQRGDDIREMLKSNPQLAITTLNDRTEMLPMHLACAMLNADAFAAILAAIVRISKPKFVNFQDRDGWTPLHWLVAHVVCDERKESVAAKMITLTDVEETTKWDWRSRICTQALHHHPLMYQCFVTDETVVMEETFSSRSSVVMYFHEHLPWSTKRQDRITVKYWSSEDDASLVRDVEAFYHELKNERNVEVVRVSGVDHGIVRGELLHAFTLLPSCRPGPFCRTRSLLPHFFSTIDTTPPAFHAFVLDGKSFLFENVVSVTRIAETFDVRVFGATESQQVTFVRDSSRIHFCGDVFHISDLMWVDDHEEVHVYFPGNSGPTALHWCELSKKAFKTMPQTSSRITAEKEEGALENSEVTNVRTLRYLRFFFNKETWPKDPFAAGSLTNSALYYLHCACAVGDIENVDALLEHYAEHCTAMVNAFRILSGEHARECALLVAAKFGRLVVVRDLVEKYGADDSHQRQLALRVSVTRGYHRVAEWLVQRGVRSLKRMPSGTRLPSMEEISFVEKHNLLSDEGCENTLRDNVPQWCERDLYEQHLQEHGTVHQRLTDVLLVLNVSEDSLAASIATSDGEDDMLYRYQLNGYLHAHSREYCRIIEVYRKPNVSFLCQLDSFADCVYRRHTSLLLPFHEGELDFDSAFYDEVSECDTELASLLEKHGASRLTVFGIPVSGCLFRTVNDALRMGYDVRVLAPLCRNFDIESNMATSLLQGYSTEGPLSRQVSLIPGSEDAMSPQKRWSRLAAMSQESPGLVGRVMPVQAANDEDSAGTERNIEKNYFAKIQAAGGSIVRQMTDVIFSMPLTTKQYVRNPNVERMMLMMFNRPNVRLHELFDAGEKSSRLFRVMDGFDFGSMPRNGELFLYLSLLCSRDFVHNPKLMVSPKHTVGLSSFMMDGVQFDCRDYSALEYPLHYLMIRMKCSPNLRDRLAAGRLLTKCIDFINGCRDPSEDVLGLTSTQFPYGVRPRQFGVMHPATTCQSQHAENCWCIFHVAVTKVAETLKQGIPIDLSTFPKCPMDLASHTSDRTTHILCCTPLMLAVRLTLYEVVRSMMQGGLYTIREERGKDRDGDQYTYEVLGDVWAALQLSHRTTRQSEVAACPPLQYALRSLQVLSLMLSTVRHPRRAQNSKIVAPGFVREFLPGCGLEYHTISHIEEALKSRETVPVADSMMVVHTGPWVCSQCGAPLSNLKKYPRDADLIDTRNEMLLVCKALVEASLQARRRVTILGMPVDFVMLHVGDRIQRISTAFDRCGVFTMYGSACGLSLVLKYAPELIPTLLHLKFLRLNFDSYRALDTLLRSCQSQIRITRRHLWHAFDGGLEVSVLDLGFTLLHWAAIHNSVELARHASEVFGHTYEVRALEAITWKLGYSPLHYACYACSLDVLQYFIHSARKCCDGRTVERLLNLPARPDVVDLENYLTPEEYREMRARQKRHAPQAQVEEFSLQSNTSGETCMHVAAYLGHLRCIDVLLSNGGRVDLKSDLERVDPYDVFLALQYKHEAQVHSARLTHPNPTPEERQREEDVSEVMESTMKRLANTSSVKKKLRATAQRTFFSLAGHYLLYIVILTTFGFLNVNYAVTNGAFGLVSHVYDQVVRHEYVLDHVVEVDGSGEIVSVDAPPPYGSQFRANLLDIYSSNQIGYWITHNLRPQLFPGLSQKSTNETLRVPVQIFDGMFTLVGAVRVSAVRSEGSKSCRAITELHAGIRECHSRIHYDTATESSSQIDKTDWILAINATHNVTVPYGTWSSEGWQYGFLSPTTELWYPTYEGNYVDLKPTMTGSELNERLLTIPKMITVATRLIGVYFTVYNPNSNMYVTCEVLFEMVPLGAVRVMPKFRHLRAAQYETSVDHFRAVLELFLIIYLLYFVKAVTSDFLYTQYLFQVSQRKRTVYEACKFHLGELGIINLCIVALLTSILAVHSEVLRRQNHLNERETFHSAEFADDLHPLSTLYSVEIRLVSCCLLFSVTKLLKYARLFPKYGPIAVAILETAKHRSTKLFVVVMLATMMGVVVGCHLAFSSNVYHMRTVRASLFYVSRIIVGESRTFDVLYSGDEHLGAFIWFMVTAFMGKFLLTILIAILGNVYNNEMPRAELSWSKAIAREYRRSVLGLSSLLQPPFREVLIPVLLLRKLPDASRFVAEWDIVGNGVIQDRKDEARVKSERTSDILSLEEKRGGGVRGGAGGERK